MPARQLTIERGRERARESERKGVRDRKKLLCLAKFLLMNCG